MLRYLLLTIIATLFIMSLANAESGLISGIWNGIHYIDGDCWVRTEGGNLTMQPGTEVRFQGNFEIRVHEGVTLSAMGAEQNQVLFTADQGTTPGSWKALIAEGTSPGSTGKITLTHCEICYGGESEAGIEDADGVVQGEIYAKIEVTYCYIHDNDGSGLSISHEYNNLIAKDNKIVYCDIGIKMSSPLSQELTQVRRNFINMCNTGMKLHMDPNFPVENNIIANSTGHGVWVQSSPGYFYNNVIDGTGGDGLYFDGEPTGDDCIRGNVFSHCGGYAIWVPESQTQLTISHNCFYSCTALYPQGVTSNPELRGDPKFVAGFGQLQSMVIPQFIITL